MNFHTFRTALLLGLTLLTALPQASQASSTSFRYPQLAKPVADTRLRVGPGAIFPQIDLIRKAEKIIVRKCSHGWCTINQQDGGPSGFMTDAVLVFMGEIKG